ncbi:MAG: FkbM family methyltransferase [Saprospiraceae bacterium]
MSNTATPFYKYQLRLFRFLFPIRIGEPYRVHLPFEKIGSDYGFVAVPKDFLRADSIVYSVGAGEDVHSDVEMVRRFGCVVHILDPTPKAIQHFQHLQASAQNGDAMHSETGQDYRASPQIMEKLAYHAYAVWDKDEILQFFEPVNPDHVSHSITNIQSSGSFIKVQARTLDSLMTEWGHAKVDYLKLDIEGAEYRVVDYLAQHRIPVDVLYLEYHYSRNMAPLTNIRMIKSSLAQLFALGYRVFYQADRRYFGLSRASAPV